MPVFTLTMHPASEGDALTLSWGEPGALHHALIDLGRTRDYKALKPELAQIGEFELFVISHIDADHISGAMPLVKEAQPPFQPERVWFNAYHHLIAARDRAPTEYEEFGSKQGEKLSQGILNFGWRTRWNTDFESRIVSTDSAEGRRPIRLGGGLDIHLLSPTDAGLAALEPGWLAELEKVHLRPFDPDVEEARAGREIFGAAVPDVDLLAALPFTEDVTKPNGSSIAFIAEFADRRVLLGADAHPSVLADGLKRLGATDAKPLPLSCVKLSHHGSKANTSLEMLRLVDCAAFAISTDGTRHGHPNPEAIARILSHDRRRPKILYFNADQLQTRIWDNPLLGREFAYECRFPSLEGSGVTIDLLYSG